MSTKNKTSQARSGETSLANADGQKLQSAYVVTEHWISDLKYYNDEIRFLRNVMDKYFLALIEKKNIADTRSAASKLSSLEKESGSLERKVSEHLKHLSNLIGNPFPYNAQEYKDEHQRLEDAMTALMKKFRTVKQEVFRVSEYAIGSEKSKHLLEG